MINMEEMSKCSEDLIKNASHILNSKSVEYSSEKDMLESFKTIASMLGINVYQVIMVFKLKHILAMCSVAKSGNPFADDDREPITGRICDDLNYDLFFHARCVEQSKE